MLLPLNSIVFLRFSAKSGEKKRSMDKQIFFIYLKLASS